MSIDMFPSKEKNVSFYWSYERYEPNWDQNHSSDISQMVEYACMDWSYRFYPQGVLFDTKEDALNALKHEESNNNWGGFKNFVLCKVEVTPINVVKEQ